MKLTQDEALTHAASALQERGLSTHVDYLYRVNSQQYQIGTIRDEAGRKEAMVVVTKTLDNVAVEVLGSNH